MASGRTPPSSPSTALLLPLLVAFALLPPPAPVASAFATPDRDAAAPAAAAAAGHGPRRCRHRRGISGASHHHPSSSQYLSEVHPARSGIGGSMARRRLVPASSSRLALRKADEAGSDSSEPAATNDNDASSSLVAYLPVVLPLLLVYISNQWSRSSLYYLVNFSSDPAVTPYTAMNVDLSFSEAQYGALASVAFTALFAVASLVAGNLSDKSDRKLLTAGSAAVWSVATLATAAASSYEQVLAARVLMGLACAFTTPAAYTLIRDSVPADRAALTNSIYSSGVYFGGALASLSILLDNNLGWRGALEAIAVYGLASVAIVAVVLPADPKLEGTKGGGDTGTDRGASIIVDEKEAGASLSLLTDARGVLSTSRVQWLFLASFLRFCSGLCIGVWSAPYFRLAFPDDSTSYAVVNAFIVGLCGVTSGVLGGYFSDKAGAAAVRTGSEENVGRLAVPIVGSLLAVPAWWLTVNASTFELAMFWLAVEYLVAECWFGPVVSVLQSSVGTGRGGTAQGMFTIAGAAGNFAPSILGLLYGQATASGVEDGSALSSLLGYGVCAGYSLSAACFFFSSQATNDNDGPSAESHKSLKPNK